MPTQWKRNADSDTANRINDRGETVTRTIQQILADNPSEIILDADVPSLADERLRVWEKIKAHRDSLQENGGVLVAGKWFRTDTRAAGQYNSILQIAAAMGALDTTVIRPAWRTMTDGVTEPMTAALAKAILLAGYEQYASIDDTAQLHKIALLISLNPSTYDYSTGWPVTFS